MTAVAVQKEVSQSAVALPVPETDQALQELVEQKLQEIVALLESNDLTFLDTEVLPLVVLVEGHPPAKTRACTGWLYPSCVEQNPKVFTFRGFSPARIARNSPMVHERFIDRPSKGIDSPLFRVDSIAAPVLIHRGRLLISSAPSPVLKNKLK